VGRCGLVALAEGVMVVMARAGLRRRADEEEDGAPPARRPSGVVPPAIRLSFDHVTPASVLVTAAVSLVVLAGTAAVGLPIWAIPILTRLPWPPLSVP